MDTEQALLRELASIEWRPGQIDAAFARLVNVAGWGVRLYRRLGRMLLRTPAYIAPSEFEGFGMPVTEALAAGLPTACSSILPFLEIAGDAAILVFIELHSAKAKSKGRPARAFSTGVRQPG
jgi:glycosyltransferase involved in cell wall biosynthesis